MTRPSLNFHLHLKHKASCLYLRSLSLSLSLPLCLCASVCERGDNGRAFPAKESVCNTEEPDPQVPSTGKKSACPVLQ